MKKNIYNELDDLLIKIGVHKEKRKVLIKLHEQRINYEFEKDLIGILNTNGFDVIEHQFNHKIRATRGMDRFCAWLPKSSPENNSSDVVSRTMARALILGYWSSTNFLMLNTITLHRIIEKKYKIVLFR